MKTLGQERAEYALQQIIDNAPKDKTRDEFNNFVAGANTMILKNGLIQALAFWLSKSTNNQNKKYLILLKIIKDWKRLKDIMISENKIIDNKIEQNKELDFKDFILNLTKLEQKKYLEIQNEVIKLLEWVKRFANADIGKE